MLDTSTPYSRVIAVFGTQTRLAAATGKKQGTVSYWAKTGFIPAKHHDAILRYAEQQGLALSWDDFRPPAHVPEPV